MTNPLFTLRIRTLPQVWAFGSWINQDGYINVHGLRERRLIIVEFGHHWTFAAETWAECLTWLESHEYGYTT